MAAANFVIPAPRRYTWRTHRFADGTYLTLKVVDIPERFNGDHIASRVVYCRMYGTAGPEITFAAPDISAGREMLETEFIRRCILHTCIPGCTSWSMLDRVEPDSGDRHRPVLIQ